MLFGILALILVVMAIQMSTPILKSAEAEIYEAKCISRRVKLLITELSSDENV